MRKCKQCGEGLTKRQAKYCSPKCQKSGRRKRIKRECLYCGKEFKVKLAVFKKGGGKYCSNSCRSKDQGSNLKINCEVCNKEFLIFPYQVGPSRRYCSQSCFGIARHTKMTKKCPICNKEFSVIQSRYEKKIYCSRKCYNSTIKRIKKICAYCSKPYFEIQSKLNSKYCSHKCYSLSKIGKSEHIWNKGKTYEELKGKDWFEEYKENQKEKFWKNPQRIKLALRYLPKTPKGKRHPNWTRIKIKCQICGKEKEVPKCQQKTYKYCSKKCQAHSKPVLNNLIRIKKGAKPWNKGTKGIMKSNQTSFKKGHCPPNKGKPWSLEMRKKLSEAHKGQVPPNKDKRLEQIVGKERAKEIKERLRAKRLIQKFPAKDTLPEKIMFKALKKTKIKFETHKPVHNICQPDAVIEEQKIAIFVDGDYFHAHPKKYKRNFLNFGKRRLGVIQLNSIKRDKKQNKLLKKAGWTVLRFWESDIKEEVDKCIEEIKIIINKVKDYKSYEKLIKSRKI